MGQNQIADLYLLTLAVKHKGALATLDHRIAIEIVRDAQKSSLLVL
jgi:predicted nucleic acid-binding protein